MWGLYLSAFWAQTCQEKLLNCCPRTHISLASQLSAWNAQDLERQPHENSIKVLRELVLAGSLIVEPWGRGEWWGLGQAFFLWIILALFSRKIAVLNLGNPSVSVGELRENPDAWIHTLERVIYGIWWEAWAGGFVRVPGDPHVPSVLQTASLQGGMIVMDSLGGRQRSNVLELCVMPS